MSVDIDRIEQMFEHVSMPPALTLSTEATTRQAQLTTLRNHIRALENTTLDHPSYPTLTGLEALFPHGGLRRGVIYDVSSHQSLLWLLLAGVTQAGHYAAIVGLPHLGLRSAHDLGVDLDKLVLLPQPGPRWWSVTNTLADALSLVVLRPGSMLPSAHQRDRFAARLRERGSTLLVCGSWPGAEGTLLVDRAHWDGLGHGWGLLQRQTLHCRYQDRREQVGRELHISISADGIHATAPRIKKTVATLHPAHSLPPHLTRQAG